MENFIVSARKYRPDSFDSVVGQENITRTLKNSISQNHLAQAYLFCGPRGVGKTTNARIFAKTINCDNLDENLNPCNQCESCKAFNEQRSMNIHELDAASNNSVEDIRNLIDQVRIPPQVGHYGVYIIDEVHMLSSSAFNAFLKTLEEPPSHAIFILATTEKHKVLPTIISRCQVFDFNRITVKEIADRLRFVADEENVEAEDEALQIIGQKSDGALRDALSIFDQIVSFSGKNITYQDAIDNLNVLDYDYYFRLTDAFLDSDHLTAFLIFNEVLENGFDGNYFINGLASHFRDILVARDTKSTSLLEVGDKIKEKYINMAAKCPDVFLVKALQYASECDYKYKTSQNKRLHVELALINISNIMKKVRANENKKAAETQNQATAKKEKPENHEKTVTKEEKSQVNETTANYNASEKSTNKPDDKSKPDTSKQNLSGSISIKDELNKKEEKKEDSNKTEQEEPEVSGKNEITQEKLKEMWLNFAEKHKNQPRLYQNLKKYLPELKGNNEFEVAMPSESMKRVLVQLKPEILKDLKTNLNNSELDMQVVTMKNEGVTQKVPYTTDEKYNAMAQNNPAVQKLRDDFDMSVR